MSFIKVADGAPQLTKPKLKGATVSVWWGADEWEDDKEFSQGFTRSDGEHFNILRIGQLFIAFGRIA